MDDWMDILPRSDGIDTESEDHRQDTQTGELMNLFMYNFDDPPDLFQQPEQGDDDQNSVLERVINFDTELPTEHSYLGNMAQVSGVGYLEAGKIYSMLIFVHHSMIFPGEILPMIIPDYLFDPALHDEAVVFGVIFSKMSKTNKTELYGVTLQIYEKRTDEYNKVMIKCRVHQRFVIMRKYNKNFTDLLKPLRRKVYAKVLILPEIILPDPLSSLDLGSLNRFRNIDSLDSKLRQIQASTTIWPQFVYEKYKTASIIERAKRCITSYQIKSMPTDLTCLSFWLCRNLIFDSDDRAKVFITNSVNTRMQIVEKSLERERHFCCQQCKSLIANCSSLFAMSKHGVHSHYCNPGGFIHETNTVYELEPESVYPSGAQSTEFSWFPGYSWQILLCRFCGINIGWQFEAVKPNLIPKCFYALSGVRVTARNISRVVEYQPSYLAYRPTSPEYRPIERIADAENSP